MNSGYYFGELHRWCFGWGNPNQAGVFLAMLLPWIWIWKPEYRLWRLLGLMMESLLVLALMLTYSRGALLSLAVVGITGALLGQIKWKQRLVIVVVLFVISGFSGRLAPHYLTEDRSVRNRLLLWGGSWELIQAAPWNGWGTGESGIAYQEWVQPLERTEQYRTMVNSYLTIGVEQGLAILGGLLFLVLAIGVRPVGGSRLCHAARMTWWIWIIANGFSTLAENWQLWAIPIVAALILLFHEKGHGIKWRQRLLPVTVFVVLVGLIGITSPIKLQKMCWGVRCGKDPQWIIHCESPILGSLPGRTMRRSFSSFDWLASEKEPPSRRYEGALIFGEIPKVFRKIQAPRKILVAPTSRPPSRNPGITELWLPEIDQVGFASEWKRWAALEKVKLSVKRGRGQDLSGCNISQVE